MLWQFGTGQWVSAAAASRSFAVRLTRVRILQRSCTPASLQQLSPVATQSHEPIDDTILHLQADDLIVLPVNTR